MPRKPKRKFTFNIGQESQESQQSERPVKLLRKLVNLISPPTSFKLHNATGSDMHVQVLQILEGCNTRSKTRQWGGVGVAGIGGITGPTTIVENFQAQLPTEREVFTAMMPAGTSSSIHATGKCRIIIQYMQSDGTFTVVKRKEKTVNGEDYKILPQILPVASIMSTGGASGMGIPSRGALPFQRQQGVWISRQQQQQQHQSSSNSSSNSGIDHGSGSGSQVSALSMGSFDSQQLSQSHSQPLDTAADRTVSGSSVSRGLHDGADTDTDTAGNNDNNNNIDEVFYDCGIDVE